MLKLTNEGATITLAQQSKGATDGMFWFAFALLIGAVAVAMAMSVLPERLAIAALGLLVVGSFVFNRRRGQRNKLAQQQINAGILEVHQGGFVHRLAGKANNVQLQADDGINVVQNSLQIVDSGGAQKYHITGFESDKEAQVMQAVLQGQQFTKRHANIKMQDN
ncbi:hypothetical protein [Psychrobacter sp. I-STPA10]|uniref:hypothetical protein n=1 Tax=Psychrobacter sp. I-STPA10 TaxID=2585769 RepID=UPI001E32C66B|nr:hypothetical protein [Psychrobacter sp. I-STPA10]